MANTRLLVQRPKAIRNIRKITRTMELIDTSPFKKAMDRAAQAEAYTRKISELAADLSASAGEVRHPLLEQHGEIKNTVLLVLCSNRGLCGGYNSAVLREAGERLRGLRATGSNFVIDVSGKRAIIWCRFRRIPTDHAYTQFEDKPTFEQVEELANRYISGYVSKAIDRVDVAYTKFINAAKQQAVVETLLPLSAGPTGEPGRVSGGVAGA